MPALVAKAAAGFTSNSLYVVAGRSKIESVSILVYAGMSGPLKYRSNIEGSRHKAGVAVATDNEKRLFETSFYSTTTSLGFVSAVLVRNRPLQSISFKVIVYVAKILG